MSFTVSEFSYLRSRYISEVRGDLIVAFQYLKGAYKQEGKQWCTRVDSGRTRGNGFKLIGGCLG